MVSLAIGRLCEKCDGKWFVHAIIVHFTPDLLNKICPTAPFATRMSDPRRLCASVTNATSVPMAGVVLSVGLLVSTCHGVGARLY